MLAYFSLREILALSCLRMETQSFTKMDYFCESVLVDGCLVVCLVCLFHKNNNFLMLFLVPRNG